MYHIIPLLRRKAQQQVIFRYTGIVDTNINSAKFFKHVGGQLF